MLASDGLRASTTRMWQRGQATEIIDTSRVSSSAHPEGTPEAGSGPAFPCWFTMRRQPLATVHAGRRKQAR